MENWSGSKNWICLKTSMGLVSKNEMVIYHAKSDIGNDIIHPISESSDDN